MQRSAMNRAAETAVKQAKKQQALDIILPDPLIDWADSAAGGTVIVLRSSRLGDQSITEQLGDSLMTAFIRTIAGSPAAPDALLLYGSAASLLAPGSSYIDVFKRMQADGCEILCCRISFTALIKADQPAVGQLTDWIDLTDRMQKARHVLWP